MIISVILDTEYMGVSERKKWFLKNLSFAKQEDVFIVTHSFFEKNIENIIRECEERFYSEFEMDRITIEQIKKISICYVPDELFESPCLKYESRTMQIIRLYSERNKKIEDYIIDKVDSILKLRGKSKPDFIFNCLHTFESIKYLSQYYNCPIIPYVFSAIRKVHGYSQTLYMSHIDQDLFISDACINLYKRIKDEELGFPILSKEEILCLIGKKQNIPLIPLLRKEGKYEVGIVGEGYCITPEIFQNNKITDDDLYYESNKYFPKEKIITRQHPMKLDQVGLGRKHMKNDPAAFILNCKRIVTVQSQMIIKAAIWNRSAIMMSDCLPYSFLLNNKILDSNPISEFSLNFILFVYFVPNKCMFNLDYWKWRMENPSIKEIAIRHMEVILSELSIPLNVLMNDNRAESILKYRGFSDDEIKRYLYTNKLQEIHEEYPTACLKCYLLDGSIKYQYELNYKTKEGISTVFYLSNNIQKIEFIPQNDLDGYITIKNIKINDNPIDVKCSEQYFSKMQPVLSVNLNEKTFDLTQKNCIVAEWSVRSYL